MGIIGSIGLIGGWCDGGWCDGGWRDGGLL